MPTTHERWADGWVGGWGSHGDGDALLTARRHHRRRWIPVAVCVVVQSPFVAFAVHRGASPFTVVALIVALAASFALLAAGRHPALVVGVVAVSCLPAIALTSGPAVFMVPLAFAVVIAVVRGARGAVWLTLAALAVAAPLAAWARGGVTVSIARALGVVVVLALLVGVGEAVRSRRERYREVARSVANRRRSEAEAERIRIARELHDVLAHSLSQISVQAGVGLHLFDTQPERSRESLAVIKQTSAQALEEVRGVLGMLRAEGESPSRSPEPGLAQLAALIESASASGLSVSLDAVPTPEMPVTTQLAVYRIVQESLTNAARHGRAATARVTVERGALEHASARDAGTRGAYVITITDDGVGAAATPTPGRGLLGMRERAQLLGGTLQTDAPPGGGFVVRARIPAPRSAEEASS